MRCRTRPRGDAGVSTVLGAILLFGLIFVVFATLRFSFVPNWENDREAQQMLVAQDEMTSFKSALDRLLANQTTSSVSTTLDLAGPHTTFLGTFGAYATASFTPGASGPVFAADLFNYVLQNGQTVSTEVFNTTVNTAPITNIGAVESLRLRFNYTEAAAHKNKDSVQMQVKDSAGVVLGTFVVSITCSQDCDEDDNLFVNVESDDAGGNVLYSQGVAVNDPSNPKTLATYWVDVLDPTFRFAQILANAPTPFSIQLTDDGLRSQYAITYSQVTSQGNVLVAGGSPVGSALNTGGLGGSLVFAANNQRFPRQTMVLENGAIVLDQPGVGQVFLVPPDLRVQPIGTILAITVSSLTLTGTQASITGEANVQLQANLAGVSSFAGQSPHLVLNYTTAYPALYARYVTARMQAAGLLSTGCGNAGARPSCNYKVACLDATGAAVACSLATARSVQVDVYGYTNSDADDQSQAPSYDVTLQATTGSVNFVLLP